MHHLPLNKLPFPNFRLIVPLIAYITRDFRSILQLLSAVHILTPFILNYVPESPRWLLATNNEHKKLEAKEILIQASKMNQKPHEETQEKLEDLLNNKDSKSNPQQKLGFLDLFKHKILLKRTLIMYFNWFINSFIVYGLLLNWQSLTGNLFVNFCIGAALDFPAKTLAGIFVLKVGNRMPYIIGVTASGLSFFLICAFDKGVYTYDWPIVTLALFGSFCISITFAILWPYTTELYPTNIR